MIDFNNAGFFKLKSVDEGTYSSLVSSIFTDGERVVSAFKGIRDGVIFTTKRIIALNVQGLTGRV